jgi:hypothetical protein
MGQIAHGTGDATTHSGCMGQKLEHTLPETRSDFLLRKGHEAYKQAANTHCANSRHLLMLEAESCWWQSVAAMTFDTSHAQARQKALQTDFLLERN